MMPWVGSLRPSSVDGSRNWKTPLLGCLLDGEAYGATLSFYLMTPFSEARYRFYQSKQQFEILSPEEIVKELGRVKSAYIVVLQNADVERLAGNLAGFGSLVYNKLITKVVIRRGLTVYQPLGNNGA